MTPAPDGHAADTEDPRGGAIASEGHFEDQIVLATGESAFKARWGYWFGTQWHN
jgi:hypothetical protein